ncbi:DUF262 domain-containing HNH endonuclease family protein [Amycolatopsis sp. OK19-0408]|uniref:DUF262 domain-containing HNH endonuclease family protein n=1 Tax=Amycolatopsis iheyensis TaxID=2945988 RepID=A0A9X2N9I3_9PSEU|nr:DUF262 domain-containing protein [Amycolatopsis iheyensis]MCR6482644.1 DUF262 domain-containing HNH endonuclease family protein [Amycolatopsis iheyensis]
MKKLEAHEVPLSKVFSSDYEFVIPDYQRPYTWGPEQATQLLEDLYEAMARDPGDPYFLGSVVLVKETDSPLSQVIDGQQRLTTLTILLSVLRELSTRPEDAANLDKLIWEPGDTIQELASRPRVRLRPRDEDFFRKYVQDRGGLEVLEAGAAPENDAQERIAANVTVLRKKLAERSAAERLALAKTIVQRTFLVVVSTLDLTSAYRIFSVMNSRGVELSPADIFKSKVIGALPDDLKEKYAGKWEDLEADLGREGFSDLFSHIRMVYMKVRAREQLLLEFESHVLSSFLPAHAADFVDEVLEPYGRAYRDIVTCDYQPVTDATEINQWLRRLHRLDNFDWQAPALWALTHHAFDRDWLIAFLGKLDRLGAWMLVRRYNTHGRGQRIGQLLRELDSGQGLDSPALELTADEQVEMIDRLSGEIYAQTTVRKYVLIRLNELLSDPPVFEHPPKIITVEHVLPQNPKLDSEWRRLFTPEERTHWIHRLANLVLLSRTKNSEAQNYDFVIKKSRYFTSRSGVSNFALTTQVLATAGWTPEVLEQRQHALVGLLAQAWSLSYEA